MKLSVITAVLNREERIGLVLESLDEQTHSAELEHIVIDGLSSDGTVPKMQSLARDYTRIYSEEDDGLYDALNKGIRRSTGEVIGVLHSDDVYYNSSVIADVLEQFRDPKVDMVYGDAVFKPTGARLTLSRKYSSERFSPGLLSMGYMPAHTTVFLRRSVFERYGLYKTDYKIAGDFEFLVRILTDGSICYRYLPQTLVQMSFGGLSRPSIGGIITHNKEILRALEENKVSSSLFKILLRYPQKLFEFI